MAYREPFTTYCGL